ncbi:MAG: hypothetical protein HOE80_03085 [Candidatus Magasanikbacteria bacterium]|jgi:uncharacterized protein YvpB|nr:hypothetical protein [Candidatus Magasanikbacteria bacterium]MBT4071684.1 hypothetical protein [Candidatus Magasanikbacteria bacterium]
MKKHIIAAICLSLFFPISASIAVNKLDIGANCDSNGQCLTGNCEDSDKSEENDNYCACSRGVAKDCHDRYGSDAGETWQCNNGGGASHGLNYCLSSTGRIKYPLEPTESSPIDAILNIELLADELKRQAEKPQTKINIPGLNFSEPEVITEGNTTFLVIPYLSEYISQMYKYAVMLAGVGAVLIIIVGGFQFTISGGAADKKEAAKKRIGGAIIGLLIAAGSYTVLYTINPNLVELTNLRVQYVKQQELGSVLVGEFSTDVFSPGQITAPTYDISTLPTSTVPMFYQCANGQPGYEGQKWGPLPYGTINGKPATVCDIGCGLASMSMILTYYNSVITPQSLKLPGGTVPLPPKNTNPGSITEWIWNNNIKTINVIGTGKRTFNRVATAYGMNYVWNVDRAKAKVLLQQKKPLIGYVQNKIRKQEKSKDRKDRKSTCRFTTAGHYIVVTGYDPVQKVYTTNDPGTRHWKKKELYHVPEQELLDGCKVVFIYVGKEKL